MILIIKHQFIVINKKNKCKSGKKIIAESNISILNQIRENTCISMKKMHKWNTRQEYLRLFQNKQSVKRRAALQTGLNLTMNNKKYRQISAKDTSIKMITMTGFLLIKCLSNQQDLPKIHLKTYKIILKTLDFKRKVIDNRFIHKWVNHLLLPKIVNKISPIYRQ